jgi:hypothetical protein
MRLPFLMDYKDFMAQKAEVASLKQARVRVWGVVVSHLVAAPVASVVYAIKTENWVPTLVGTGVAIVGLPLALIDLGITSTIIAPVASAGLFIKRSLKKREEFQFLTPEQADVALFEKQCAGLKNEEPPVVSTTQVA